MSLPSAHQAQVVRRNEVCFKYAKWRMTERDGHCGIAELELRNFVYVISNNVYIFHCQKKTNNNNN